VVLPGNLKRLASLDLDFNRLRAFSVPESLSNILRLTLLGNQLTNLILPASMTKLGFLDVGDNQIASLKIPAGFTNLNFLRASGNILTNVTLSEGLTNLSAIFLRSNQLSSITLPAGLTHLVQIDLISNRIESLTLPPDIAELLTLGVEGNPLATLTLSDSLAATGLSGTVATLRGQGVSIFTFPIDFRLRPRLGLGGALELTLEGPPGIYSVLDSTNLAIWKSVAAITNQLGSIVFQGDAAEGSPQRFFRAQTEGAHGSMVFISPGTFMMGTAANEMNRQPDEGPQTTVTISRGFWMGKYEVTQREYLAVVGSNPSQFTGDLDRPVETVSWLDATNYCAILTQRELAAGRISVGSRYRLPTEAEWECAARAGASTRFSYGDDPTFTGLRDQAWYSSNSGFGTHPVGQKLPNAWGLYDMEGNVLEWTLDWYGPYSGGSVVDPHGPESNAQGARVIRGGAWDSSGADCRSGRRLTEGVHPFIHDFILGFRVVLVTN
jgi:formylglycine-generating enzyme required for sulfatase activity